MSDHPPPSEDLERRINALESRSSDQFADLAKQVNESRKEMQVVRTGNERIFDLILQLEGESENMAGEVTAMRHLLDIQTGCIRVLQDLRNLVSHTQNDEVVADPSHGASSNTEKDQNLNRLEAHILELLEIARSNNREIAAMRRDQRCVHQAVNNLAARVDDLYQTMNPQAEDQQLVVQMQMPPVNFYPNQGWAHPLMHYHVPQQQQQQQPDSDQHQMQ